MSSVTEMLIRNSTTPPIPHSLVSSAEIEAKIRFVTTYVRRVYFEGGTPPADATDAIVLLVLSNVLAQGDLAREYGTLVSERFDDYEYSLAGPMSRGTEFQSDPNAILKTWHQIALEILADLSANKKFQIRKANE